MDSAKTDPDEGTSWAPEDRAWLWYNDTIETHAFALRTLIGAAAEGRAARRAGAVAVPEQEAQPLEVDARHRRGASTRWSHYLEAGGRAGRSARTAHGDGRRPERDVPLRLDRVATDRDDTGEGGNQVGASPAGDPGPEVDPRDERRSWSRRRRKGLLFASATWHFSTERLPTEDARRPLRGRRARYFRRVQRGRQAGRSCRSPRARALAPGDELEVQLSLRAQARGRVRAPARPARGGLRAGERCVSRYKWETSASLLRGGARQRRELLLRVAAGGRVHLQVPPAGEHGRHVPRRRRPTVQSMYAPEFTAYSAGNVVTVAPAK